MSKWLTSSKLFQLRNFFQGVVHLLFVNFYIDNQLNFAVFFKLRLWFICFFTVVIQAVSVLLCLFLVEDMAPGITVQIKGSLRSLNTTHLYTNPYNTSVRVLLLMFTQFGVIYLMMSLMPQLSPLSEKS